MLATLLELRLAVLVPAILALLVVLSPQITPSPEVRSVALFVHLASMIVALGGVIAIQWYGILWMRGQIGFASVVTSASILSIPIWVGYAGLVTSGVFLDPDLDQGWIVVKMVSVGFAGVLGIAARSINRRLRRANGPTRRLLRQGVAIAVLAQIAWWTAVIIGLATTRG